MIQLHHCTCVYTHALACTVRCRQKWPSIVNVSYLGVARFCMSISLSIYNYMCSVFFLSFACCFVRRVGTIIPFLSTLPAHPGVCLQIFPDVLKFCLASFRGAVKEPLKNKETSAPWCLAAFAQQAGACVSA